MSFKTQTVERILKTIEQICHSPTLRYYRLGYTSLSAQEKQRVYQPRHLVVLADKLTKVDALDLEHRLQMAACGMDGAACDKSSILYQKYDPKRRGTRYWRNDGGNLAAPLERVHSVYMVWKEN